MNKIILHCDMNNFYASVECALNPKIKNKPVVVCGAIEDRHGIVLAKNYIAKKYNINTADTIWQAKQKCPDLLVISPPKFDEYEKYSHLAIDIYNRFTDKIESYGLDECWLDISEIAKDFTQAEEIANNIREIIKFELGLTISVGVSYNKIFAKFGSDLKKPDATTVITPDNFKTKIWNEPVESLLGVGNATKKILNKYYIYTIGDLAKQTRERMKFLLGKNGAMLLDYANGLDNSEVAKLDDNCLIKSISHGTTTIKDLTTNEEVFKVILSLTQEIAFKLRQQKKRAKAISIHIKNNLLFTKQWQKTLDISEQSSIKIAESAFELFKQVYNWDYPIRSITIQVMKLVSDDIMEQNNIFIDTEKINKLEKIEKCIDNLNDRFGSGIVKNATLLDIDCIPKIKKTTKPPTGFIKQQKNKEDK